ncbi:MAG TPA: chemotaxis protein CheW [Pseudomonadota bacterium]|jgi:purine-binding chemotaxis protein CheW|nr:chemotaxis protein CheW [Pseudomonadota bacterium]
MSRTRSMGGNRPYIGKDREREKSLNEVVQLCGFRIGDEEYALDIMRIKEIINPLPITRVPKAAKFIEGVVELRGSILPVVDMRKRFEVTPLTAEEQADYAIRRARKYLIVPIEGRLVGLIVDRVSEVLRVSRDAIRPPPLLTQNENARYFAGVCHHRGRILMVLDLDVILSSTEKISLAGLNQAAKGAPQ